MVVKKLHSLVNVLASSKVTDLKITAALHPTTLTLLM